MEPFDVLNMGNISYFHLEHSNCYLFYVFKFRNPYLGPKKNSSDYGVYCIQNDWLEPTVSISNISGPGAYFSKPIFALKPWVQAGRFEYHKPHDRKNFFFTYVGVPE